MRFSLLLLDDDEAYIEDHAATHFATLKGEGHRGRLRVATKSLFFEPEQLSLPILRFPFARLLQLGERHDRCVLVASEVTEMRKGGRHYPYVVHAGRQEEHALRLDFLLQQRPLLTALFLLMSELLRCSRLEPAEARTALAAIVARHRDAAKPFSLSSLVDLSEELLRDVLCSRVKPCILQPCRCVITSRRLYLQPVDDLDGRRKVIDLAAVTQVFRRRHSLRETGVELLLQSGKTLFLAFGDAREREQFWAIVADHPIVRLALSRDSVASMTAKWAAGELSNFDYLMHVNSLADRTRNDLAQYPVFPWVLTDYTSAKLDLSDPRVFRNLAKPIGALNPQRLEVFRARMREMPKEEQFLYGTHYSTPGYVLFYLVRKRPDLMLRLQNGKFDAPDRAFFSIAAAWSSCLNSNTDVKELIPEFFYDASVFENRQHLELGTRQNGTRVDNVELPPWAGGSAQRFVELNRAALESDYVSQNLHLWIDLIFGCRQRDAASDNLFFPLTYQGHVNVAALEDPGERQAVELQINEFGQTPKQVFSAPHPKRFSKVSAISKEPSFLTGSLQELLGTVEVTTTAKGEAASCCDWEIEAMRGAEAHVLPRLHRDCVTGLDCDGERLASVSRDGFVKINIRGDAESGLKQTRASNLTGGPLTCCQLLGPDLVLVGAMDSKVYSYSIQFGKCVDSLLAHDDTVSALRCCNGRLVTGGWDTLVRLWELKDGVAVGKMAVGEVQETDGRVMGVDVAPNGVFVSAGSTRIVAGDFRVPRKVVRVVELDDCDFDESVAGGIRLLGGDGRRAVFGNLLVNLGDGSVAPLFPSDRPVGAVDASGSLALLGVANRVELWDTAASPTRLALLEEKSVFSGNADRVSAVCARGACLYAATEKGSLLWL